MTIAGTVEPGFEPVRDAFADNFERRGEVGAACAAYADGKLVVDLWGGMADPAAGRPWTRDTTSLVYSATKGATAICVHLLAQRGELELDAPVACCWPEFAAAGKEELSVRMLLCHRAGLPALAAELSREEVLARQPVLDVLAGQAPLWPPGTAHGYHALTFGSLLGEVVRRVSGRPLGRFFAEEVAAPLELDFWIGLPAEHEARVATLVDSPPPDPAVIDAIGDPALRKAVLAAAAAAADPTSLLARVMTTSGALPAPSAEIWNDSRVRAAELPAASGITDARSLARMYAACVTEVDGMRLLSDRTLLDATAEHSAGPDRVLIRPTRFGAGFMLESSMTPRLGERAFGHSGVGGAFGFADADARLGFGYVPNRIGNRPAPDPRSAALIDALRGSLR